jgi:hypothetical protein
MMTTEGRAGGTVLDGQEECIVLDRRRFAGGVRGVLRISVRRSPEELAELALTADSPDERDKAAAELIMWGDVAIPQMRQVLDQSKTPEVRAAMIQGLAQQWDFDSMPTFLDAMDDESLVVRSRAGGAVQRLLQGDYGYRADDPPKTRERAVKSSRREWDMLRDDARLKWFKEQLKQKRG